MSAQRCTYVIVKRHRGQRFDIWRRRCQNKTTDPSGLCHTHQPPEQRNARFGRNYRARSQ